MTKLKSSTKRHLTEVGRRALTVLLTFAMVSQTSPLGYGWALAEDDGSAAVEAQATDRAHRIGQTKTVFVHSFIAEGTLEERVDEMLERKSRVAGTLVASGERFCASFLRTSSRASSGWILISRLNKSRGRRPIRAYWRGARIFAIILSNVHR